MIERVAKAIWERRRQLAKSESDIDLEEWGDGSIPRSNHVFAEARAAIEAMREPTEAMLDAAYEGSDFQAASKSDILSGWRSMVGEALKG